MTDFRDPKTMATLLTQEGFLKWAEGNPLTKKDFKPQWEHLFKDFVMAPIAGEAP